MPYVIGETEAVPERQGFAVRGVVPERQGFAVRRQEDFGLTSS